MWRQPWPTIPTATAMPDNHQFGLHQGWSCIVNLYEHEVVIGVSGFCLRSEIPWPSFILNMVPALGRILELILGQPIPLRGKWLEKSNQIKSFFQDGFTCTCHLEFPTMMENLCCLSIVKTNGKQISIQSYLLRFIETASPAGSIRSRTHYSVCIHEKFYPLKSMEWISMTIASSCSIVL
jgi:hypothetical protein